MFEAGKLANLTQEIKRLDVDILGVSETWWPDNGMCAVNGGRFYYSGNQNKNHQNGMGIFITDKLSASTMDFFPYSDRFALLKLSAKPVNLNVIQTYAPTAESTEQEFETFYEGLKEVLKLTKKHKMNIIKGDFNAKIGKGRSENLVGPFVLGDRNEKGDRLL